MKIFRQPLRNCLKDYKGQLVKIGSKGGISFWFCDKVNTNINKHIQDISDNYHNQLKRASKNKKYRLAHLEEIYEGKINKFNNKIKNPKKRQEYLEKATKRKNKELELLPKQIMSIGGQLKSWTDLLERKVVDVYKGISPDETDTMVIMIRGQEKGKYWTIKEYQDRDKKIVRGVHDGIIK